MQRFVSWTNEPINVLGVIVTAEEKEIEKLNCEQILQKVKTTLNRWASRSTSLFAKVLLVNSLVASQFVYKMMVLPSISHELLKKINDEIFKFVWNGSRPKINKATMLMCKHEGGAGLINLEIKDRALKATWAKILQTETELAYIVYINNCPVLMDKIWDCTLHPNDVKYFIQDKFWLSVFKAWFEYKWHNDHITKPGDELIWLNSRIKIMNQPICWKKAISNGLLYLHQLFENGAWISKAVTKEKFGLSIMSLNSLKSAIPKDTIQKVNKTDSQSAMSFRNIMCKKKNLSSIIYKEMLEVVSFIDKTDKWSYEMKESINTEMFIKGLNSGFVITNIPIYRSFNYRLLHRAVITNIQLSRWSVIETENCTFCKNSPET